MSKSRGNVVDPFDRIEKYSSDAVRYFLLREGVPHSNGSRYILTVNLLTVERISLTDRVTFQKPSRLVEAGRNVAHV